MSQKLGKPFMPWQSYVADVALEIDPDTGRLAYDEVRITVPRQSGKSTWVLAKAVHRASATQFFGPRQKIVYTAQTRLKAREKWEEDYAAELEVSRAWRNKVAVHKANGNEHIRFANKSRFGIESNTEKAGHGSTLDEAYIDEAFAQVDGRLEQAFSPAMITRPNKQLVIVSTAGWLDGSPYLWAKVEHGRRLVEAGTPTRVAYFEWSAPQDADPFDRAVWWECMPALGVTITEEAIASELERMQASPEGLNGFRRAYLNQWVPKSAADGAILPEWSSLAVHDDQRPAAPAFAVETTQDQAWTAVCVAGQRLDGRMLVEVADYRAGSTWAIQRVLELQQRWGSWPVVIDPREPAGALIADLEAAGVRVVRPTSQDVAHACAGFYNAAVDGTLAHRDDEEIAAALRVARQRPLSDAWAWDRKTANVAALFAATLAAWGASRGVDVAESVW